MFSLFSSKSADDNKTKAREAFEKVAGLKSDSREARSARLRMGLLCRAHIDKTFIDGAEKTATWQDLVSAAVVRGQEAPAKPVPVTFQTISTASGEVTVYLPDELIEEVFTLGSRYQKTELTVDEAIQAVQALADQLFRLELRMDQSFDVLQFLREEATQSGAEPARMAEAGS